MCDYCGSDFFYLCNCDIAKLLADEPNLGENLDDEMPGKVTAAVVKKFGRKINGPDGWRYMLREAIKEAIEDME